MVEAAKQRAKHLHRRLQERFMYMYKYKKKKTVIEEEG